MVVTTINYCFFPTVQHGPSTTAFFTPSLSPRLAVWLQGTLQFRTFHAEAVGPGISEEINSTDFDGSYDVSGY